MRTRLGLAVAISCALVGCRTGKPEPARGAPATASAPAEDIPVATPSASAFVAHDEEDKGGAVAATPPATATAPAKEAPADPAYEARRRSPEPPPPPPRVATPSPRSAPPAAPRPVDSPSPPAAGATSAASHAALGPMGGAGGRGRAAAGDDAWGFAAPQAQFSGVKAGEWDDNANYREFQKFLGSAAVVYHPVDLRYRRFLVVRDGRGLPIPRCRVKVTDNEQHATSFLTTASGRAIFFPKGESTTGARFKASAECADGQTSADFALTDDTDGVVDLKLQNERKPITTRTLDVAFVLDTTGSMGEEIDAVRQTIQKVAQNLQTSETRVRIGLVEYKDRTDPFVTKVYPMSQDLQGFAQKVSKIQASGGGDTPEDMNAGLHTAITQLEWSDESVARLAFVIADAPPHLDYQDGPDYANDMKTAAHRGIQLFTVAASGMDLQGQVVMRQMAQYTGGTNMYVLRGGAGPQSTGGGDPGSSCGGTHQNYASGNLHELIVAKIKRELKSIDGDPMRIAGLRTDENAKPCDQRVVWLD
jgi:Mg-chelatase subunit ChlD